jgi:hypothetical protein
VVNATPWQLYPREGDPVPIVQEARWAPERMWTAAENLSPTRIGSLDRTAPSESSKKVIPAVLYFRLFPCQKYENLTELHSAPLKSWLFLILPHFFFAFSSILETGLVKAALIPLQQQRTAF